MPALCEKKGETRFASGCGGSHLDQPQDGLDAGVPVGHHQRRAVLAVLLAVRRQAAGGVTARADALM